MTSNERPSRRPQERGQFQFSLRTLLVSTAVVAYFLGVSAYTSLFVFLPVVPPVLFFVWLFQRFRALERGSSASFFHGVVFVAVVYSLVCFLSDSLSHGNREPRHRMQCMNNLQQIGTALRQYHDVYGSFPPACIKDVDGRPMHSWRILILPYLDEESLYERYRFDEPWDGPSNRKLAHEIPRIYRCPADELWDTPVTSYLAVNGSGTVWPPDATVSLSDVEDGTYCTLMIVESAAGDIHWMEPRDLDAGDLRLGVNNISGGGISSCHQCCWRHPVKYACIALADGSVRVLGNDTNPADLRAMATIAGGEEIDLER